jgi:hypothetical protein
MRTTVVTTNTAHDPKINPATAAMIKAPFTNATLSF